MTQAHPIPATIDALVALWSTHPDLTYIEAGRRRQTLVVDGPPLAGIDDPRYLVVGVGSQTLTGGLNPFAHADAAESRTGFGGGGRRSGRYEVSCQLGVWSGDVDLSAVRTTAFEALEVCVRILTANRTLSGVVDWARIERDAYQPMQGEAGAGVAIDFTVRVEATRFEGV